MSSDVHLDFCVRYLLPQSPEQSGLKYLRQLNPDEQRRYGDSVRSAKLIVGGFIGYVRTAIADVKRAEAEAKTAMADRWLSRSAAEMGEELTYRVLNVCAAIKMYDEHSRAQMKTIWGEESDQFRMMSEVFSTTYDTSLAYRLLYRVRNISVHGIPSRIMGVEFTSRLEVGADGQESNVRYAHVYMRRGYFVTQDVAAALKKEVRALDADPDLVQLCAEVVEDMEALNRRVVGLLQPEICEDLEFLVDLYAEAEANGGSPVMVERASMRGLQLSGGSGQLRMNMGVPPMVERLIWSTLKRRA